MSSVLAEQKLMDIRSEICFAPPRDKSNSLKAIRSLASTNWPVNYLANRGCWR
ncbi:hypothetical protein [Pseudomonas tolaasii]|uniref:hypothetical protein n=1 Tax=Pseudomonas tolaasii TaxID=29442 RepID=UPI0002E0C9F1|nr:hypothetical protein [Pseudomonas tolaasii]